MKQTREQYRPNSPRHAGKKHVQLACLRDSQENESNQDNRGTTQRPAPAISNESNSRRRGTRVECKTESPRKDETDRRSWFCY